MPGWRSMAHDPHRGDGFEPGAAAWGVVLAALLRVVGELALQGFFLGLFLLGRERWRRELGALVGREPLPVAPISGIAARRSRTPLLLALAAAAVALPLAGCATERTGSRSSWDLLQQDSAPSGRDLANTFDLLEGNNDWQDVRRSGRLLSSRHEQTGFDAIRHDLHRTFAPPFNFDELRDTFRLLR